MGDEQREERSQSSDERQDPMDERHDQEKAVKPEAQPKPRELAAQEIEAEDRFEATDN